MATRIRRGAKDNTPQDAPAATDNKDGDAAAKDIKDGDGERAAKKQKTSHGPPSEAMIAAKHDELLAAKLRTCRFPPVSNIQNSMSHSSLQMIPSVIQTMTVKVHIEEQDASWQKQKGMLKELTDSVKKASQELLKEQKQEQREVEKQSQQQQAAIAQAKAAAAQKAGELFGNGSHEQANRPTPSGGDRLEECHGYSTDC